jgi:hypothetical protein
MKVKSHLFDCFVDIKLALSAIAGQEGNDGPEYDLMAQAAKYINDLEFTVSNLRGLLANIDYETHLDE